MNDEDFIRIVLAVTDFYKADTAKLLVGIPIHFTSKLGFERLLKGISDGDKAEIIEVLGPSIVQSFEQYEATAIVTSTVGQLFRFEVLKSLMQAYDHAEISQHRKVEAKREEREEIIDPRKRRPGLDILLDEKDVKSLSKEVLFQLKGCYETRGRELEGLLLDCNKQFKEEEERQIKIIQARKKAKTESLCSLYSTVGSSLKANQKLIEDTLQKALLTKETTETVHNVETLSPSPQVRLIKVESNLAAVLEPLPLLKVEGMSNEEQEMFAKLCHGKLPPCPSVLEQSQLKEKEVNRMEEEKTREEKRLEDAKPDALELLRALGTSGKGFTEWTKLGLEGKLRIKDKESLPKILAQEFEPEIQAKIADVLGVKIDKSVRFTLPIQLHGCWYDLMTLPPNCAVSIPSDDGTVTLCKRDKFLDLEYQSMYGVLAIHREVELRRELIWILEEGLWTTELYCRLKHQIPQTLLSFV